MAEVVRWSPEQREAMRELAERKEMERRARARRARRHARDEARRRRNRARRAARQRLGSDQPAAVPAGALRPALIDTLEDYARSDGGDPLGRGMPERVMREDGESHRQGYMRLLRYDPCSICGARPAWTIDHIIPVSARRTGALGAHRWQNYAGMCQRCNGSKGSQSLLAFLLKRATAGSRPSS